MRSAGISATRNFTFTAPIANARRRKGEEVTALLDSLNLCLNLLQREHARKQHDLVLMQAVQNLLGIRVVGYTGEVIKVSSGVRRVPPVFLGAIGSDGSDILERWLLCSSSGSSVGISVRLNVLVSNFATACNLFHAANTYTVRSTHVFPRPRCRSGSTK
jgi:hypothetical protein